MKSILRSTAIVAAGIALSTSALAGCNRAPGDVGVAVGYSSYTVSNPFFAGMQKGLETGSAEHGFDLISTNANNDANQQVSDIQNLINRGAKYILLVPADGKAVAPAIAAADAAKVPVIVIADTVEPPVTSTIALDNVVAGRAAAQQIIKHLQEKYGSPRGNVVNITGLSGTPSATGRNQGFVEEIGKYPEVKIVATADGGYDTEKSNTVMSDILQAQSQIDAVFSGNDAQAVGVSKAIQSAGRFVAIGQPGHIYVIGVDGSAPAIADIRNGIQDATISQNPIKMAEVATDLVADLEAGKTVEKNVVYPLQLIDASNINSKEVADYGIWADEVK